MERGFEPFLISAIENANDAVIVYQYDPGPMPFKIRYVNPMFEKQTGFSADEAMGSYPDIMYGPKTDRAAVVRVTQTLLAKLPIDLETLRYRKDGTTFWAAVNMRPLVDGEGNLMGVVAIQRDVTEQVNAKERLEMLSAAMEQASDAMVIFEWADRSNEWRLWYVNDQFLRMVGYRRDEIVGRSSDFLIGPETNLERLNDMRARLLDGEQVTGEIALYRSDGSRFWAELNGRPFKRVRDNVTNTIIVYRDVTEEHERERQLTYEASHDPLTGAYNRRAFERALDEAIAEVRHDALTHGLLYLDLDGFKPVNDRYGHEAGDQVLVQLAACVNVKLRRVDVFARIGGDEFAVLLRGCPPQRAGDIAREILDAIANMTLLWNGHALRVGASIGVAMIDETVTGNAEALRRADQACYEAKRAGRNQVFVAS